MSIKSCWLKISVACCKILNSCLRPEGGKKRIDDNRGSRNCEEEKKKLILWGTTSSSNYRQKVIVDGFLSDLFIS